MFRLFFFARTGTAGWSRLAARVAGLSRSCQSAVALHCGGVELMRCSNRKRKEMRNSVRTVQHSCELNGILLGNNDMDRFSLFYKTNSFLIQIHQRKNGRIKPKKHPTIDLRTSNFQLSKLLTLWKIRQEFDRVINL